MKLHHALPAHCAAARSTLITGPSMQRARAACPSTHPVGENVSPNFNPHKRPALPPHFFVRSDTTFTGIALKFAPAALRDGPRTYAVLMQMNGWGSRGGCRGCGGPGTRAATVRPAGRTGRINDGPSIEWRSERAAAQPDHVGGPTGRPRRGNVAKLRTRGHFSLISVRLEREGGRAEGGLGLSGGRPAGGRADLRYYFSGVGAGRGPWRAVPRRGSVELN